MSQHDLDALTGCLVETFRGEEVTLFVGAGISLEPPANLPTTMHLKWRVLKVVAGREAAPDEWPLLNEYLGAHMLELFIQDLEDALGPGAVDVLDVFRGGAPNRNHRLIARLAKDGLIRRVLTTNFDCLIERALAEAGVEYQALTTEHDFAQAVVGLQDIPGFQVIKLHGTAAFLEGGRELPRRRDVRAISPLKLKLLRATREIQRRGGAVRELGFERTVSAKETLIGTLSRMGLGLSEAASELLVGHLRRSTVVVMGWNGFDLDISPLVVEHARKVLWLVHASPEPEAVRQERAARAREIERVRGELRSRRTDSAVVELALLNSLPGYPLDVLPSPSSERRQFLARSPESAEFTIFTPDLVERIGSALDPAESFEPSTPSENPLAEPHDMRLGIPHWSDSLPRDLPLRWAFAKLFVNHGEHDATQEMLVDVHEAVARKGLHDLAAMIQMDLGDVHAIHGDRTAAEAAYREALRLCEQEILPSWESATWIVDRFHLAQLQERALFGIGELACEFYDFAAAARAFGRMRTDAEIVQALVHYCREEFDDANRVLSQTQFARLGWSRFHYYLHYYLTLVDGRIHWMRGNMKLAVNQLQEVLTAATKLGLPRLQVQALNSLSITYSTQVEGRVHERGRRIDRLGRVDPYYDVVEAGKLAAQSIAIANQAEYRYGRAHAGYYLGIIAGNSGLMDVAASALRHAHGIFAALGHEAGWGWCRQARLGYGLDWEDPPLASAPPAREPLAELTEDDALEVEAEAPQRVDVCWLDFWGGAPAGLNGLLEQAGFRKREHTGGLQVWTADELPEVVLEVLDVGSYPSDPASKLAGWTAELVDQDRRETCVQAGMDPTYRCMLYAAETATPRGRVFDQLSEARSRLSSRFVDIASFLGADVQGEWALWRRKRRTP